MADIIQLLPDHVANQIAAGEVVQRPASVVKELLENAIDADATVIKLIIKDAGKTLIQVIDNGKGMSVTDARLSFERHATSKIKAAEDLFNLHTKGFRGEALASIAAIAHVELKTKQSQDEVGTQLKIEGSEVTSQEVVVTPNGTSISVKNLFYNIPARRNFLKSITVETRHIIDEFHRVTLAHPTIEFSLYNNGSELFHLPISNYRQRLVNTFGNKTNEKLVPVEEETEVLKISGFVVKPEFAKKTRGEQYFFVNNRFIKSSYLNHSVNAAFDGLLKPNTHASYFLYLTVNPKSIDINIHPTKTEIKFDDEHTLYAILRSSIKHSLGQFNIAPVLDFDRDNNLDTPYNYQQKAGHSPTVEVDRAFNPFREEKGSNKTNPSFKKENTNGWESLYVGLESKGNEGSNDFSELHFESENEVPTMFNDGKQDIQKTFQLKNKFIINTIKSGMLVIDQHRAHQRILYEEFLEQITIKEGISQQLLFPISLQFDTEEIRVLKALKPQLEQTGFMFSKFDDATIELQGIPVSVTNSQASIVLEQLIHDAQHEIPDNHFSQTDMLAKSLAKSLAIRTGQHLTNEEQEHLVNKLFACKEPTITPTNKPTFITLDVDDLDKKFM
ncbi:MAG: DNA mismatch repair endonuclease MutL [Bacteroidetes bacterium]|nr:MAG: DNA mismatch repair endonuclease MutL [Bacteroidota bacterium]